MIIAGKKGKKSKKSSWMKLIAVFVFAVGLASFYFVWVSPIFYSPSTREPTTHISAVQGHSTPPSTMVESLNNPSSQIGTATEIANEVSKTSSLRETRADVIPPLPSRKTHPSVKTFPNGICYTSINTSVVIEQQQTATPSVLVVGGTDGSGTRRVVQLLTELGVTMVSEDPETYDIHADIAGGWPPIVKPILSSTHSLIYDPNTLDQQLQAFMSSSLTKLLRLAEEDATKPESKVLAKGGALDKPPRAQAAGISYGFKAPVAMTLVPWWARMLPDFKFLHVLRDGRDIAFSANQGPVDKFYDDMYGRAQPFQGPGANAFKAIRLWSDWNMQIHNWSQRHAAELRGKPGRSFGYLAIHSEDLVSQAIPIRFAAIMRLAEFTGSNLSERDKCCLAMRDSEFMGSHDRSAKAHGQEDSQVTSRYGKWKKMVQNNQALEHTLLDLGRQGLQIFGYEPLRPLADASMVVAETSFQCSETNQETLTVCDQLNKERAAKAQEGVLGRSEQWDNQGGCTIRMGVDYPGGDLTGTKFVKTDRHACCRTCMTTPGCTRFTADAVQNICYLKRDGVGPARGNKGNLVSGTVVRVQ